MHQHFLDCEPFLELYRFLNRPAIFPEDNETDENTFDIPSKDFMLNSILDNYEIIGHNQNWSQFLFLEAYCIKTFDPCINQGLKASRELVLFS